MRTTIDLPADLHHAVNSIASHTKRSMNQTVADLIRRGLASPVSPTDNRAEPTFRVNPATGLPLMRSSRPVTAEDVHALDDES